MVVATVRGELMWIVTVLLAMSVVNHSPRLPMLAVGVTSMDVSLWMLPKGDRHRRRPGSDLRLAADRVELEPTDGADGDAVSDVGLCEHTHSLAGPGVADHAFAGSGLADHACVLAVADHAPSAP